jgi:hypothetical protein
MGTSMGVPIFCGLQSSSLPFLSSVPAMIDAPWRLSLPTIPRVEHRLLLAFRPRDCASLILFHPAEETLLLLLPEKFLAVAFYLGLGERG